MVKSPSHKVTRSHVDLSVKVGKIRMENPVMVASGTFGYGKELEDLVDIKRLGAIVTKTITRYPRSGNRPPRIAETPSGMLNSIGLENDGVDSFIEEKMPYLKKMGIPVIVSAGGERIGELVNIVSRLNETKGVSGIEINISCPNLEKRGKGLFSQDRRLTAKVVKRVRKATRLTLFTKLTPNVTDISEIARAAEGAGSDALSLVNTYAGMAVDIHTKKPRLGNITGGLSGPAIKPLALKAVWDTYNSVGIPIIGMGGIATVQDVIEFIICGARAVSLGSINFVYPNKCVEIADELAYYMKKEKIRKLDSLIGSLKTK
jgi:dihydroorotate dehydrogenase (NAD+) catalytic subunit